MRAATVKYCLVLRPSLHRENDCRVRDQRPSNCVGAGLRYSRRFLAYRTVACHRHMINYKYAGQLYQC